MMVNMSTATKICILSVLTLLIVRGAFGEDEDCTKMVVEGANSALLNGDYQEITGLCYNRPVYKHDSVYLFYDSDDDWVLSDNYCNPPEVAAYVDDQAMTPDLITTTWLEITELRTWITNTDLQVRCACGGLEVNVTLLSLLIGSLFLAYIYQ